ncbi:hypothetical protein LRP31_06745 [Mesorhizobium mediterraneum]|uniref:Uncharacterized protein n=1 Tax=Mesorhizobium mediterraneum TaxID=43617 RepID=A0AB36R4K4_9HYPH|nr:hypothetical protein [Mesorhizobium mediterraneum]PAP99493.1 hypothetical protein CIT25_24150 [Mesorhizobium mediterraneum]RWN41645.1 MAG: hypothetical protein EOR96_12635 [Mesorhizobium sp.]WIW54928.1 hypothetical protein LRP31_06745 [Mesorhizobium mediterraneum]
MSARETLAVAHQRMTPTEIAAHALDLADEVEVTRKAALIAYGDLKAGVDLVASLRKLLNDRLARLRSIVALFERGRKMEARKALRQAVAAPEIEETEFVKLNFVFTDEIFDPFPERKSTRHG